MDGIELLGVGHIDAAAIGGSKIHLLACSHVDNNPTAAVAFQGPQMRCSSLVAQWELSTTLHLATIVVEVALTGGLVDTRDNVISIGLYR